MNECGMLTDKVQIHRIIEVAHASYYSKFHSS